MDGTWLIVCHCRHSLGGATAVLCALDLYHHGHHNIEIYTQGQPRVGTPAFAKYVIGTKIPYQRLVNERDSKYLATTCLHPDAY